MSRPLRLHSRYDVFAFGMARMLLWHNRYYVQYAASQPFRMMCPCESTRLARARSHTDCIATDLRQLMRSPSFTASKLYHQAAFRSSPWHDGRFRAASSCSCTLRSFGPHGTGDRRD
eukprot:365325-Chlamydomonas_euryale.AAC.27